jgi:hypothetical protein
VRAIDLGGDTFLTLMAFATEIAGHCFNSNRARSYTLHIAAGLSLLTAAAFEAPACKRIDLARTRFLTLRIAQPPKSTPLPIIAELPDPVGSPPSR